MKYFALAVLYLALTGCAVKAPMVASPTADGKYWVLKEPLVYQHPETKEEVTIPRGFVTDLASIPRGFWIAFPPCDKYTTATVLHDYLYWVQSDKCNQECADDILLLAMKEAKVDITTSEAIHLGVRIGGESAWEDNAKLKAAGEKRIVPEELMDFTAQDTWEEIKSKMRSTNESAN